MNRTDLHTVVAVRCVDQHEYSLRKTKDILSLLRKKSEKTYKGVGVIGPFFAILIVETILSEFDSFGMEFSS
jgi:hypothetical protein